MSLRWSRSWAAQRGDNGSGAPGEAKMPSKGKDEKKGKGKGKGKDKDKKKK